MSKEPVKISPEQLPDVPEAQVIEPIVQCGVLYLGSAVPTPGRRGIDSVQEPLSHRYPVDGTNTARGIDSILSIYDNGMQLAFSRQPHTVIFFPITSLLYCASLRFSIVECDETDSIDWRFVTLDSVPQNQSKHPPIFCAVVQRTQITSGDECHCFVTKDDDAALTLVRTISEIYANLPQNIHPFKSPVFYQLDRYSRKLGETSGIIYLAPDDLDESQLNRSDDYHSSRRSLDRNYLLDPSAKGYFYRTDASIIEKWELWDDSELSQSRPRPPPSPFGLHHGLYHDDLTQEVHRHLSNMDDEDRSSSCSCSSSSSLSCDYNRRHHHRSRRNLQDDNTDQINPSTSQLQPSSFDPSFPAQNNIGFATIQKPPIIVEKVVPNVIRQVGQPQPTYIFEQPEQPFNSIIPVQQPCPKYVFQQVLQPNNCINPVEEPAIDYAPMPDSYYINESGEKITPEGNRILFMDAIQPNPTENDAIPIMNAPQLKRHRRRHRRRRPDAVPVIDLESIESILNEENAKYRHENAYTDDSLLKDKLLKPSDMLDIVEEYFEDYQGRKINLKKPKKPKQTDQSDVQYIQENIEYDSTNNHMHRHRRRHHDKFTSGPKIDYSEHFSTERTLEPQRSNAQLTSNQYVDDYVSNTRRSSKRSTPARKSSTPSVHPHETQYMTNTRKTPPHPEEFISPLRYMQSSINPTLLREYRDAFSRF